jgi:7-keto-8-aminopelargonate synthetase-like enzyme
MTGAKPAGVLSDCGGEAAVAEFIRTKGVTRCPTACVLPTQAAVAAADQAALQEYAAAREQVRRARAAARLNSFFPVISARPAAG